MVMCFVPDCKHYSERNSCRFFSFPKDAILKRKWIAAIRRDDRDPSNYSLVCSCHFKNGKINEGPTIFQINKDKYMSFDSPEKKSRFHEIVSADSPTAESTSQPICNESFSQGFQVTPERDMAQPGTSKGCTPSSMVESENYFLTQEVMELKGEIERSQKSFSLKALGDYEKLIALYTGLLRREIFNILFELCCRFQITYFSGWKVEVISKEDQLLMTLMKLRQNFPHRDLAFRFNCSVGTVTNVTMTWLHVLHEVLVEGFMNKFPSLEKNKACLPSCFENFKACRVVLDCTEVYTAIPESLDKQSATYSHYKHRNTLKGMVGVSPNGVITFVSKLYGGSTSDKKIVQDSGILTQINPGDLIIADKGFLINDIVPVGVSVNIPHFLTTPQFTRDQVLNTRSIARARIHVERAICRVKGFSILNFIPQHLLPYASKIFQVCAALTNFQNPLIKEVDNSFH